eukprot:2373462-Prymnesium_polylepis.2
MPSQQGAEAYLDQQAGRLREELEDGDDQARVLHAARYDGIHLEGQADRQNGGEADDDRKGVEGSPGASLGCLLASGG